VEIVFLVLLDHRVLKVSRVTMVRSVLRVLKEFRDLKVVFLPEPRLVK
jgi:hypothetical protein